MSRTELGPAHIIFGLFWFVTLFLLIHPHSEKIDMATLGIFSLFGKNSLFVYGLHGLVLFPIMLYLQPENSAGIIVNTLFTIDVIVLIYGLTRYKAKIVQLFANKK